MIIRQEVEKDHETVFKLIEAAFRDMEMSDQQEHFLVERLRLSDAFILERSLGTIEHETIIGHILLTRISIVNEENVTPSLALAPVSVLPEFQGRGVGSALIIESHKVAKYLGHDSIVLVGHPNFYPRFGYEPIHRYGISLPFYVPEEVSMIEDLSLGALNNVKGEVMCPMAFYGE